MGAAIDRLMVKLARVQWDPYVAKRGKKIVPVAGHVRHLTQAQAEERSRSPEVLKDVKVHPDAFFDVDKSIRLYNKMGVTEPWNEWEWPRRLAANRQIKEKLGAKVSARPKEKTPEFDRADGGAPSSEKKAFAEYLKANDYKMFHRSPSADEITKRGLLSPKDKGEEQISEEDFEDLDEPYLFDGVFVGSRERVDDFDGDLLEIDMKGLEGKLFEWDDDEGYEQSILVGSISPDRIKRVK